jgi:hypothetical protein
MYLTNRNISSMRSALDTPATSTLLQQAPQPLTHYPISTVPENASSILKRDRLECSAQRFDEGFPAPSPRLAKKAPKKREIVGSEEGEITRRASQDIGG